MTYNQEKIFTKPTCIGLGNNGDIVFYPYLDIRPQGFDDYKHEEDEVYHKRYSYEHIAHCNELGLENIEEYTCPHQFVCDCGTVSECEMLQYYCLYCGKPSK